MMKIKALAAAAACAFVLPALAAESTSDTAKAVEKSKAEAKADAKKPVAKEQVAGQVSVPAVTKDSVDAGNGAAREEQRFSLKDARWVHDEDNER